MASQTSRRICLGRSQGSLAGMRVLFLFGTEPDGPLVRKLRAIQSAGAEVHLLYLHRTGSNVSYPFTTPLPADRTHRVDAPDPHGRPLRRAIAMVKFGLAYSRLVGVVNPHVVHAVGFEMYVMAWVLRIVTGAPLLIYDLIDTSAETEAAWIIALHHLCVRSAAAVFVTSPGFFSGYLDWHRVHVPFEKRALVANAPSEEEFRSFRRKSGGPLTIGYIGTIRCRSALDQLFAATAQVRQRGHNVRLFFAGSGIEADYVRRAASRHPWVQYVGPYSYERDIVSLYGQVDVVFAIYDMSRNKRIASACRLSEAVVCGLPILVSSDTYMGELVEQSGIGEALPYGDVDKLADAIAKYAQNDGLELDVARARASAVRQQHLFEAYAGQLTAVYSRFAGAPRCADGPAT